MPTMHKQCRFKLNNALSDAEAADLKNKLEQQAGVQSVIIESSTLQMAYDLNETRYQSIHDFLKQQDKLKPGNAVSRLLFQFRCFREQNEYDHLSHKTNWPYYVQNLYLSLNKESFDL